MPTPERPAAPVRGLDRLRSVRPRLPDVELIAFGSFNPRNANYQEGGLALGH